MVEIRLQHRDDPDGYGGGFNSSFKHHEADHRAVIRVERPEHWEGGDCWREPEGGARLREAINERIKQAFNIPDKYWNPATWTCEARYYYIYVYDLAEDDGEMLAFLKALANGKKKRRFEKRKSWL